ECFVPKQRTSSHTDNDTSSGRGERGFRCCRCNRRSLPYAESSGLRTPCLCRCVGLMVARLSFDGCHLCSWCRFGDPGICLGLEGCVGSSCCVLLLIFLCG